MRVPAAKQASWTAATVVAVNGSVAVPTRKVWLAPAANETLVSSTCAAAPAIVPVTVRVLPLTVASVMVEKFSSAIWSPFCRFDTALARVAPGVTRSSSAGALPVANTKLSVPVTGPPTVRVAPASICTVPLPARVPFTAKAPIPASIMPKSVTVPASRWARLPPPIRPNDVTVRSVVTLSVPAASSATPPFTVALLTITWPEWATARAPRPPAPTTSRPIGASSSAPGPSTLTAPAPARDLPITMAEAVVTSNQPAVQHRPEAPAPESPTMTAPAAVRVDPCWVPVGDAGSPPVTVTLPTAPTCWPMSTALTPPWWPPGSRPCRHRPPRPARPGRSCRCR